MEPSRKPLNVLTKSVGNNVTIALKNRVEYWGRMIRCDGFMNILLTNAKEYNNAGLVVNYGDVFIRGNNILYISLDGQSPPPPRPPREREGRIEKEKGEEEEESEPT